MRIYHLVAAMIAAIALCVAPTSSPACDRDNGVLQIVAPNYSAQVLQIQQPVAYQVQPVVATQVLQQRVLAVQQPAYVRQQVILKQRQPIHRQAVVLRQRAQVVKQKTVVRPERRGIERILFGR